MNTTRKQAGFIVITIIFLALIFSSCSSSNPKCSSDDTTDLVKQIIREQLATTITYGKKEASQVELSIDAIRTTDVNEKTGCQSCAAQLTIKNSKGRISNPLDFSYTTQKTDDDDQIYVTIYGISPETLFML